VPPSTHFPAQPDHLDSLTLRAVCSHFVTGVTVITSGTGNSAAGTTVNSFTSVSLKPPLVLFCLHRQSRLRKALDESQSFVVNFLAARQQLLAWAFAGKGNTTIQSVAHHHAASGVPILSESMAFLACRLVNEIDGGDHLIFLGEVIELGIPGAGHDPLIFFRGSMGALEDGPTPTYPIVDG
jgi:flavin reductase (DIM6/NTAB) family NADH-FMN oxidoreductase RutF